MASHNYFTFYFGPINFEFGLTSLAFSITPIDAQFFMSLEPTDVEGAVDYCFGLQMLTDAMDLKVEMNIDVLECDVGLIGLIIGDYVDCYWNSYNLEPLSDVHIWNILDTSTELIPWFCSYESE